MHSNICVPSWTIQGVSPTLRKAAREAARRQRMPLAKWIEQAVQDALIADSGEANDWKPADPRPNRRYF